MATVQMNRKPWLEEQEVEVERKSVKTVTKMKLVDGVIENFK